MLLWEQVLNLLDDPLVLKTTKTVSTSTNNGTIGAESTVSSLGSSNVWTVEPREDGFGNDVVVHHKVSSASAMVKLSQRNDTVVFTADRDYWLFPIFSMTAESTGSTQITEQHGSWGVTVNGETRGGSLFGFNAGRTGKSFDGREIVYTMPGILVKEGDVLDGPAAITVDMYIGGVSNDTGVMKLGRYAIRLVPTEAAVLV